MADIGRDVLATVGKHFVSLSCVRQDPTGARTLRLFSGFIIEVCGEWLYCTAGHILRDIDEATLAGCKFDVWRLGDQTAGGPYGEVSVTFDFDRNSWLVLEDEASGLDYAAVHIGWPYRDGLHAGGVSPIGSNAWGHHLEEHDYWALVGIPSESVEYDGKSRIAGRAVLIPLRCADAPQMAGAKAANQFYALPTEPIDRILKDADGLSGGPVFALKKIEGIWTYMVIGIQSAWYRASGTMVICPFVSFAQELETILRRAMDTGEMDGNRA